MIHHVNSKDFILQDMDTKSLLNSKAKLNLLLIKAKWCHYCTKYIPEYKKYSTAYKNINFLILEITSNSNEKMLDHWKHLASPCYEVNGYPTVVIYDQDGKVIKVVEDRFKLENEIAKLL